MSYELTDVIQGIETEIAVTKARLSELHSVLETLKPLTRKGTTRAVSTGRPGRRGSLVAKGGRIPRAVGLPATNTEFWLSLIGDGELSVAQLVDSGLAKLKARADLRKILYARASAWLTTAVKTRKVRVAGERDGVNLYSRG